MTNNTVFNSAGFKWVLNFDPETSSIQWDKTEQYASSINAIARDVIASVPTLTSKQDQKIVKKFNRKLAALNECFADKIHTPLFNDSVEALGVASSAFNKELSPQVSSLLKSANLNEILRGEGDKKEHLEAFLKELHSVLHTSKLSKQDLLALQKVAQKCHQLSQEIQDKEIESLMGQVIRQFKYHGYLQSPLYQHILHYQPGMLKGKDPQTVANEMIKLAAQLALFAEEGDYPIDDAELHQVFENIKVIQEEFVGHSRLFAPALKEMKTAMTKRFQAGLESLDLDSHSLRADVVKLKQQLRQIYPKGHPDLNRLEAYLNELVQPSALKPSESEEKAVMWIRSKYPQLQKAEYEPFVAQSTRIAREKLLSTMQENAHSLESLCGVTQKLFPVLKRHTMKYRLTKFLEDNSIQSTHLVNRFPVLVDYFDRFTMDIASKTFFEKWDAIKEVYDQKTNGKFSKLSSQLGYMDMDTAIKDKFIPAAQSEFLKSLDLEAIDEGSEETFKAELMEAISSIQEKLPVVFNNCYGAKYQKQHLWMVRNAKYMEVVFDQSLDIHKNVKYGTCYQNSLSRQALLLKNPSLSAQEMPLGSTSQDRFNTARIQMTRDLAKPLGADPSEAKRLARSEQSKVSSTYELKSKRIKVLSEEGPPSKEVVDDLVSWAKRHGETQLVVTFQSPGHAFNIQIDETRGIFRFMDDNVGFTRSYPDLKTFKAELTGYLEAFYPKAEDIKIRTFRRDPSLAAK